MIKEEVKELLFVSADHSDYKNALQLHQQDVKEATR